MQTLDITGGPVLETRRVFHAEYGNVIRIWITNAAHTIHRAILTKPTKKLPRKGDFVRWTGDADDTAFWSASNRAFVDQPITKFGAPFDPHARTA